MQVEPFFLRSWTTFLFAVIRRNLSEPGDVLSLWSLPRIEDGGNSVGTAALHDHLNGRLALMDISTIGSPPFCSAHGPACVMCLWIGWK